MFEKFINNRLIVIYILPFCLGLLTVFSFQPFNLSFINFFILPIFFLLVVNVKKKSKSIYRKKPYRKNLFLLGMIFGFGFYLSGIFWIAYSLTFDESFKFLIPVVAAFKYLKLIFLPVNFSKFILFKFILFFE